MITTQWCLTTRWRGSLVGTPGDTLAHLQWYVHYSVVCVVSVVGTLLGGDTLLVGVHYLVVVSSVMANNLVARTLGSLHTM